MTVLPQQEAAYMPYITVTEERTGGTGPTGISNLRNFCISNYPFQRAYCAQLCFLYARQLLLRSFPSSGGSVPSKTSSRQGHAGCVCLSYIATIHGRLGWPACGWLRRIQPLAKTTRPPLPRGIPSPEGSPPLDTTRVRRQCRLPELEEAGKVPCPWGSLSQPAIACPRVPREESHTQQQFP